MTNIGIKSTQLSNIRAALLENAQNSKLEPKQTENYFSFKFSGAFSLNNFVGMDFIISISGSK